jgi:hypothetical protein
LVVSWWVPTSLFDLSGTTATTSLKEVDDWMSLEWLTNYKEFVLKREVQHGLYFHQGLGKVVVVLYFWNHGDKDRAKKIKLSTMYMSCIARNNYMLKCMYMWWIWTMQSKIISIILLYVAGTTRYRSACIIILQVKTHAV